MTRTFLTLISLAAASALAFGADAIKDEAEFQKLMKEVNETNKRLKTGASNEDSAALSKDATRIGEIYTLMAAFWKTHKAEKAIKWAEDSSTAAKAVATAATAKDWAKAREQIGEVGKNCKLCHETHRDRQPDGTSKIKF